MKNMSYYINIIHCLKDRYAETRVRPPIDKSQDWFLISGEEENGFTILEFSRNLTTCDTKDLEIKVYSTINTVHIGY